MTLVCKITDIIPNTGVCAAYGDKHVAIFKTPDHKLYAIDNIDPFTKASVLARGLIGEKEGKFYVASPIYKQKYDLESGQCLNDDSVKLEAYQLEIKDDEIYIAGVKA